jgi:alkanesulfonate monooxygenase SsuD/methylene tetrahydromethanopterin reductase-like flavin-dependent oxidoreductase (luciferase family)
MQEGQMRVGAILSPTGDWPIIVEAAKAADAEGLDAIGMWDHYHSDKPEWSYACGWSAYGALAALTSRVRLVPMVLNNLHYEPGVLAKESSILSIASGGRFELAIGAGDWPDSFKAWGRPYPPAAERVARLVETVRVLRLVWSGKKVDFAGTWVELHEACCSPAPPTPPRVMIGVGGSRRTLAAALDVADELNIYAVPELVNQDRTLVTGGGRPIDLSVSLSWEMGNWPANPERDLATWRDRGIDRAYISLAAPDMVSRVQSLASAARAVG